jgi:hypothetical protein
MHRAESTIRLCKRSGVRSDSTGLRANSTMCRPDLHLYVMDQIGFRKTTHGCHAVSVVSHAKALGCRSVAIVSRVD